MELIARDTAVRLAVWLTLMERRATGRAVGEIAVLRDAVLVAVRDGEVVLHVGA